ncbi:MAG: secretin N-terminal domain-containing protein, partial [Myxococcota bacterium]
MRLPLAIASTLALSLPVMPEAFAAPPTTRGSTAKPTTKPATKPAGKPATRGGTAARGGTPGAAPTGGELSGDEGGGGYNTCKRQPKGARFRITLPEEAELKDLINWMSSISCQKFILDLKARAGKVTILSPEPVTIEEAYAAFYASLQTMGLTVEPSGKYFKIVETTDANSRTLPVYTPGSRAPTNDRYVTQLYRTKSEDNGEIINVINKLKTKQGSVEVVGNLLILTDTGSSIARLIKIIRQIDKTVRSGTNKVFFFQLQHADPEETATIVREVFGEKEAPAKAKVKKSSKKKPKAKSRSKAKDVGDKEAVYSAVIVDERTGTLIVVAGEEDYNVIRRLIEQLDVALVGGSTGRIHVVPLKNADPEEVASVLTQLGQGGAKGGSGRGGRNTGGQAAQPTGPASAELFSGEIKVTADPATRSLVILASQSDFRALRKVIDALDAERKQVYIEIYLLELSIGHDIEGGASAHFGAPFDVNAPGTSGQGLGFVGTAPDPTNNSLLISPAILNGIAAGALGPEVPRRPRVRRPEHRGLRLLGRSLLLRRRL